MEIFAAPGHLLYKKIVQTVSQTPQNFVLKYHDSADFVSGTMQIFVKRFPPKLAQQFTKLVKRFPHFVTRFPNFVTRFLNFVTRFPNFVTRFPNSNFVTRFTKSVTRFTKSVTRFPQTCDLFHKKYVHRFTRVHRCTHHL
jgi:hypothetical protein